MRYTFDVYETSIGFDRPPRRMMTTTNIDEISQECVEAPYYVTVYDNLANKKAATLMNTDDLFGFRTSLERAAAWKPKDEECNGKNQAKEDTMGKEQTKIEAAVNPKHYQSYLFVPGMVDLQWLEAMQYLPAFVNSPEKFEAAVELQIRKYLDRCGKKDNEIQELFKAMWYLKFLIAYKKNKGPIFIQDIETILGS